MKQMKAEGFYPSTYFYYVPGATEGTIDVSATIAPSIVSPFKDDMSYRILKPLYKYSIPVYGIFGAFYNYDKIDSPKTMIHELGHALFDLPDLYDMKTIQRNYENEDNITGIGNWSVMATTVAFSPLCTTSCTICKSRTTRSVALVSWRTVAGHPAQVA